MFIFGDYPKIISACKVLMKKKFNQWSSVLCIKSLFYPLKGSLKRKRRLKCPSSHHFIRKKVDRSNMVFIWIFLVSEQASEPKKINIFQRSKYFIYLPVLYKIFVLKLILKFKKQAETGSRKFFCLCFKATLNF